MREGKMRKHPECAETGCRLGIEAGPGYFCTSGVCGLFRVERSETPKDQSPAPDLPHSEGGKIRTLPPTATP